MNLTKFSVLKRRADLTTAQFSNHWHSTHVHVLVEKGKHKTYNKRYVQNHFIHGIGLPGLSEAFDGAAQMIPQSAGVVTLGLQEDPVYAEFVRPDEDLFLDVPSCVVIYCESDVMIDHLATGPFKLLKLMKRNPELTHEEFVRAWRAGHELSMKAKPEFWNFVRGYTQHDVLQDAIRGMAQGERSVPAMAYDGVNEIRFDTLADLQLALSSSSREFEADEATFLGCGSHTFVAREEFIYDDR